jgi:hypothetical protein
VIAGHFAFAAGVKAGRPAIPLWALMLGTVWLDVVFGPLLAFNVERLEPARDAHTHYGGAIIHADYTHSLVGALVLSAAFGLMFLRRWGRPAAITLAAVAFSHWILDLVVHRPDLPLLPGNWGDLPRLGFGLWREPLIAGALEIVLVVAGTYLYWRAAKRTTATGDRRPPLIAALMLACGLATLAINVVS